MKMEPMKRRMEGVFTLSNKSYFTGRSNNINAEELEIRPGGMVVQKRDSNSNISPVPIPAINIRVKYSSTCHHICISSQASFGDLKTMLAESTGVHHQDQKLIYKKKERNSREFLDVSGVKDGSEMTLIEDITSRERRYFGMLKSVRTEKASKLLQQTASELDKLRTKVVTLEEINSRGEKVAELDLDRLTGILMDKLVALDGIVSDGDLKLQKGFQERRVKNYIVILDKLKIQNSEARTNKGSEIEEIPVHEQQKQSIQHKQKHLTIQMPIQKQMLNHSKSFIITTKWEIFD